MTMISSKYKKDFLRHIATKGFISKPMEGDDPHRPVSANIEHRRPASAQGSFLCPSLLACYQLLFVPICILV